MFLVSFEKKFIAFIRYLIFLHLPRKLNEKIFFRTKGRRDEGSIYCEITICYDLKHERLQPTHENDYRFWTFIPGRKVLRSAGDRRAD
jgi:hypothetical protein